MAYDFDYYMTQQFENSLEELGIVFIAVYVIAILIALASWIMRSIAITHLGKRRGIAAPWLVWLPIVGVWSTGALADEYDGRLGMKRHWRVLLLVLNILIAAGFSAVISAVISATFELAEASLYYNYEAIDDFMEMFILLYAGILVISLIASIQGICSCICLFKIFESTLTRRAVLCFVLSILVPLAEPICLLCAMNKGYPEKTPALPSYVYDEAAPEARGWYEAE